ncbi:MAG: lipopolysaccharide heptosyltransferase II [Candidatus Scalindua sp.]|nr:lipopolysaccharide heptosyltransferase II [Candidatus Scalindua sp.]
MGQIIKAKKILVRAPNWVGDVVMATPSFRCIRENFKDSHITLLIKRNLQDMIKGSQWFDELIALEPIERRNTHGITIPILKYLTGITNFFSLIYRLRQEKYEICFLFPNSFSSALSAWLSGIKIRVGYKRDARSFLLTDGLERRYENGSFRPSYMVDYYLRLCTHVGCKIDSKELELFISKASEETANHLFRKYHIGKKPFVLINPGASYGSSKCWYPKEFARSADLLKEKMDCDIVLVCGPGETRLTDEIEQFSQRGVINLSEDLIPLDVLKVFVKRCMLLITVDSGPRHFAVALRRPVVVLMGPTDPRYTQTEHEIGDVIRAEADCSPCHLKTCPTDHRCMVQISPEKVVHTCMSILENRPSGARCSQVVS